MLVTKRLLILVTASLAVIGCGQAAGPSSVSVFRWDLNIEGSDPVGDMLMRELGVRIAAQTVPWTGWSEKLNAMVASGNLPDIFVGYGIMSRAQYDQWIRDGILLPLSDHLGPFPNLREYAERWADQRVGGKLYSLPVEAKLDHVLMVRADWLALVNLRPPRTVEDLRSAARAFRDRLGIHPIGSSAPHTAGLFWLNMFLYAFGSSWEDWEKTETGEYVPSWIAPRSLDALRFLHDIYAEGLLDPDFVTDSDDMKRDKFANGKVGIVAHNLIGTYRAALRKVDPAADIAVLPPVSGPGGQGMWGLSGYFSAVMLNAALEEPKRTRALRLLDYLYSDEGVNLLRYGVEGVHHRLEGGRHVPLQPSDESGAQPVPLQRSAPHAVLKYLRALDWMWNPEWSPDYAEMQHVLAIGEEYGRPVRFPYVLTEAQTQVGQQLVDFTFQEWVKLITASRDLQQDWAKFVARFRELGGDRLIEEMNAATAGR